MQNRSIKIQDSVINATKTSAKNLDLQIKDQNIKSFFEDFFSINNSIQKNKFEEKEPSNKKIHQQKQIQPANECEIILTQQKQNFKLKDHQKSFQIIYQELKKLYSSKSQINPQPNQNSKGNYNQQQIDFKKRRNIYNQILGEYQNTKFQYKLQNKQKYKIEIFPFMKPQIEIIKLKNSPDYSLVWYQIYVSYFKTTVCLKNVSQSTQIVHKLLGKGSYGSVYKKIKNQKQYAVKRIYFEKKNQRELIILDCLKQYSIYKIASFLEIGPKLSFTEDIQVTLYDDALQFQMEFCELSYFQLIEDKDTVRKRQKNLKQNLAILHQNKIVHRDVKPENALYSKQYKKYVLSDFGASHPIKQQLNIKTYTGIRGTRGYIPDSIYELYKKDSNQHAHFDLYYLDVYALNKTLQVLKIKNHKTKQIKDKIKENIEQEKEKQKNNAQYQYLKFPQLQKLHFQIRVQGFNRQIQDKMELIIKNIEDQNIKNKIDKKLKQYIFQYNNKKRQRFYWSKKCQQIQQYFINKGYEKMAQNMLLQRLEILTRTTTNQIDKNVSEIIKIYENLIKYSISYDLTKSKHYLKSIKQIIQKKIRRTIQQNLHFQYIYQSLDLLIKVYENNKGVQYQIYNLLVKYKNQFDIWKSLGQYAKPFAINNKLSQAQQIYQIAMKIRQIIKLNGNRNQNQYLQQAQMYLNLARISTTMQQFQKAISESRTGLNILINQYGQNHKYYQLSGFFYNNIGFNYLMIYKLPESLSFLIDAQKIHRSNYGRSTFLSQTVNNIGCVYRLQGNFIQALKYQMQSLNIRMESAGQDCLTTSYVIRNLASTQLQKGDLLESLWYFNKFQNIYKKLKLIQSRQIVQCKYNMVFIHMQLQNQEQINLLMSEINCISKEKRSYICYQKLRAYNLFKKNYQKCKISFQKSFSKQQKIIEARIKLYLDYLQFNLEVKVKQNKQIIAQLQQLLAKINQPNSFLYARYYYLNSRFLFLQNTIPICLQYLQKAIKLFKSYFQNHYILIDCYLLLLQISNKQNRDNAYILQIRLNLDKIFEYHKYKANHSKILKFKSIVIQES